MICSFVQLLADGTSYPCRHEATITIDGPEEAHVCARHARLCVPGAPLKVLGWGIPMREPGSKQRAAV
jgi:hypothetical protein